MSGSSKKDTNVAAIILGLVAVAIIAFFIFKPKEQPPQQKPLVKKPVVVKQVPVQTVKPKPREKQPVVPPGSAGKIAIIIDDWGQTTSNCKYLKEIPESLAIAILPGLPHTRDVANCAKLYRKVVMLHLPLEALHNSDEYPTNYIIKTTMKPALVSKIVNDNLAQLPYVEGVNNHMGSKATANKALMKVVFKEVRRKGLFFVDSVTSSASISASLAEEMGMPFARRDIFLDNVNTREAIAKQFAALAQKARQKGYAIAIGHDRRLTMQMIKEQIPLLKAQGFQIVNVRELLKRK